MLVVIGNHTHLVFSPLQKLHDVTFVIKKCNRDCCSIAVSLEKQYRPSPLQGPLVVSLMSIE